MGKKDIPPSPSPDPSWEQLRMALVAQPPESTGGFAMSREVYKAVFHPCVASCMFLGRATQKSHKFSLQPKLRDSSDALSGSRDVTCCFTASTLPSVWKTCMGKQSLNLIPEAFGPPRMFISIP